MTPQEKQQALADCTPASIAAAKAARDFERLMVYAQTGLRITDDGTIRVPPGAVIMLCPKVGCTHAASARTEGRAIKAMAGHLISRHGGTA